MKWHVSLCYVHFSGSNIQNFNSLLCNSLLILKKMKIQCQMPPQGVSWIYNVLLFSIWSFRVHEHRFSVILFQLFLYHCLEIFSRQSLQLAFFRSQVSGWEQIETLNLPFYTPYSYECPRCSDSGKQLTIEESGAKNVEKRNSWKGIVPGK